MENLKKPFISSFRTHTLELLIRYFVNINMEASLDNVIQFTQMLMEKFQQNNMFLMPRYSYENTLDELKTASLVVGKKTRREYHLPTRYEILQCGDVEKLIKKRKSEDIDPVYFVSIEETFGVINRSHIATGHGEIDRMQKYESSKYANIQLDSLELFKSICLPRPEKKSRRHVKGVVVKLLLSDIFNSRIQVDLIDMQSSRVSSYNWILVAQCHLTKFVVLKPLPALSDYIWVGSFK